MVNCCYLHLHTWTWYTLIHSFDAAVISATWSWINPVRLLQTVDAYVRSVLLSLFHYFDRKDEFSGPRSSFFFFIRKENFHPCKEKCVYECVCKEFSGWWSWCIKPLVFQVTAQWDVTCGPLSVWSASFLESSQIHCLALLLLLKLGQNPSTPSW